MMIKFFVLVIALGAMAVPATAGAHGRGGVSLGVMVGVGPVWYPPPVIYVPPPPVIYVPAGSPCPYYGYCQQVPAVVTVPPPAPAQQPDGRRMCWFRDDQHPGRQYQDVCPGQQ